MSDTVVIVAAKRTAIGSFQGQFSSLSAPRLGSVAIAAALAQSGLDGEAIEDLHMGCVLPAGLGQAPARQAALGAGLPLSTPCTTVNKMCGSGMKAVMYAYDQIRAGGVSVALAGGIESMTNAPYLLAKARGGYRMGHGELLDHMFTDGLQDVKEGKLMGVFAQRCADHYHFSRERQDEFSIASVERALRAIRNGDFADEIAPVEIQGKKGAETLLTDEQPGRSDVSKIPQLKPAFGQDGTVTAASSSSISDGAAALILMSEAAANARGVKPLARILGHTSHAQDPAWFTTAPVQAMAKLHEKLGWNPASVDLYEINEAFAVVALAAMHELQIPHDKTNVNGGACALGHPVGVSGARILVTLLHALRRRAGRRGVASLCIGGGEATAMAIELI